ncbi:MAG: phage major capsid protein [Clostridia bacterium]|nr:phage major capsid protein [Clostridia bacterium]MBQ8766879.1 phage major capsid protein [Clostridia bacterium]
MNSRNKTKTFSSFGEQLQAVHNAAKPGGYVDERLANLVSGNNEGVPTDGGYLVQADVVTDLKDLIYDENPLLTNITRLQISTGANALKINGINENSRADGNRFGGIMAYWESEAAEIASSKPSFKQHEFKLNKLAGICYATDELLEDAPALGEVIKTAFSEEFEFKVAEAVLYGTGKKQPLGIFNSDALVVIPKEAGQTELITVENLTKMLAACDDRQRRAEWYVNRDLMFALMALRMGDTPVFIPKGSIANAPYDTLFGKPVHYIEQANEPGAKGDIMLADMSRYTIIEKGGIKATESIHVRFVYDETAFRFVYRLDGKPTAKAVTPYKGTQAISPFVTLEARVAENTETE